MRENIMDTVFITDLQIKTVIGLYEWERKIKQKVSIDIEMAFDISKAAETDDIKYALDYKSVGKSIIALVESNHFFLVEKMCEEIAQMVLRDFDVSWLRLKLSKPGALRGSKDVGVIIERGTR